MSSQLNPTSIQYTRFIIVYEDMVRYSDSPSCFTPLRRTQQSDQAIKFPRTVIRASPCMELSGAVTLQPDSTDIAKSEVTLPFIITSLVCVELSGASFLISAFFYILFETKVSRRINRHTIIPYNNMAEDFVSTASLQ